MASKKDKFRKEVKKTLGQDDDSPSMGGIVGEIAGRRTEKGRSEDADTEQNARSSSESDTPEKAAPVHPGATEEEPVAATDSSDSGDDEEMLNGPGIIISEEESKSESRERNFRSEPADKENREKASSERIDPAARRGKTGATERMARKRDSIYNVSSDIRLEDYTEADRQRSNNSIFKMAGVLAVALIIGVLIWQAAAWLLAPSYQLAVANQEITAANIEQFSKGPVARLSASSPVHIRFQWEPGELKTDYLKILVERDEGGNFLEEAVLGRRPPRTASYIYFMGPLDSGKYRIQVLDAGGAVLSDRDLELQ